MQDAQVTKSLYICPVIPRPAQGLGTWLQTTGVTCYFGMLRTVHKGEMNLNFRVELRKCNIMHFPTNGHPWD